MEFHSIRSERAAAGAIEDAPWWAKWRVESVVDVETKTKVRALFASKNGLAFVFFLETGEPLSLSPFAPCSPPCAHLLRSQPRAVTLRQFLVLFPLWQSSKESGPEREGEREGTEEQICDRLECFLLILSLSPAPFQKPSSLIATPEEKELCSFSRLRELESPSEGI